MGVATKTRFKRVFHVFSTLNVTKRWKCQSIDKNQRYFLINNAIKISLKLLKGVRYG